MSHRRIQLGREPAFTLHRLHLTACDGNTGVRWWNLAYSYEMDVELKHVCENHALDLPKQF